MKKLSLVFLAIYVSAAAFAQGGGDLENQFYFRFGLSKPTKSYLGVDEDSFWDDTKRTGFVFEMGSIFMMNAIPFPDGLRLGINGDYVEFTYQQLKYDGSDAPTVGLIGVSSKVGPSLSYSPVSGLVFDTYLKANINWLTVAAVVYDDSSIDDEGYGGFMNVGYAAGFNVRYKFLMMGFEFNKTRVKLTDVDDSDNYIGDYSSDSEKTPLPYWNIMFGFSF